MHWSSYEVFSVLSGIALLVVAAMPGVRARDRALLVAGGAFFLGYGLYVASQSTGTWTFPRLIFFIPFVAVGLVLREVARRKGLLGGDGAATRRLDG